MSQILFALLFGVGIVLEVVVPVGKTKAALIHIRDYIIRIVQIGV